MLIRFSKLAVIGVFLATISLSHSSRTNLRGEEASIEAQMEAEIEAEAGEIEYITLEDIDAMMELEDFENNVLEGGLRKLASLSVCTHGGQPNQFLTAWGRNWGNCQSMNGCVCGINPRRMAYWCPDLCNPGCGGKCAYTPGVSSCSGSNCKSCPNGFNIENGVKVMNYNPSQIDPNDLSKLLAYRLGNKLWYGGQHQRLSTSQHW